jgi:uncharacterized protein YaaN involved in tellurite resistance
VESQSTEELLAEAKELVPKDLKAPKDIPAAEIEAVESRALAIVDNILKQPEDRSTVRELTILGEDIQSQAGAEFRLLRTSLGKVMDRMKRGEKGIPQDLKRLRDIMDQINPYPAIEQLKRSQTAGFFSRLLRRVPGIGKILADIAQRYESVQTQIDAIIQSLEAGSDKLLENSLEIEERYKNLKALQKQVKIRAYQLQLVFSKLEEAKDELAEATEQQAVEKALAKIIRRVQNLKVTENAFAQFFITMNVTMDNHENLRDAVRSMTGLTRPVLENGLALKIAQQEERQIAEALAASQDYLGSLMVAIAQDSMDNAALTAEVTNKPLIKLQDLMKSYKVLMNRMDEAAKIEAKMVESAKQNISQLENMTAELEERAKAQETARETSRRADA